MNEAIKITASITCNSKNLIYLIECKKCHLQHIGETKHQFNERFGEHRSSILNHQQLSRLRTVSLFLENPWERTQNKLTCKRDCERDLRAVMPRTASSVGVGGRVKRETALGSYNDFRRCWTRLAERAGRIFRSGSFSSDRRRANISARGR